MITMSTTEDLMPMLPFVESAAEKNMTVAEKIMKHACNVEKFRHNQLEYITFTPGSTLTILVRTNQLTRSPTGWYREVK